MREVAPRPKPPSEWESRVYVSVCSESSPQGVEEAGPVRVLCQGASLCLKLAAAGANNNLAGGNGSNNDVPAAMLDWGDREGDRFSFEDSDRFEEDSLCSWSSEPESLCNNWRGWKKPSTTSNTLFGANRKSTDGKSSSMPLCSLFVRTYPYKYLSLLLFQVGTCPPLAADAVLINKTLRYIKNYITTP